MNSAHLHVIVNHLPIIGLPLALLLLGFGLRRGSRELSRAGLVLVAALSAAAPLVKLSGDQAEEAVENTTWASESAIEDHEEAAERATIAAAVLALVAGFGLWRSRQNQPVSAQTGLAVLGLGAVVAVLMALTGLTGGAIRHDEFGQRPAGAVRQEEEER